MRALSFVLSAMLFAGSSSVFAAPLALQQRVAAAYDNRNLRLSEISRAALRNDVRARVRSLEGTPDIILDYWKAALTDGGSSLSVIFLEYQLSDGGGAVETFAMDGRAIVRGRFNQFTSLTWEFQPVILNVLN